MKVGVPQEVRDKALALLRHGLTEGSASLTDYETAVERALAAETESEVAELVRRFAPPVPITPAERRLGEPLLVETNGMFQDIKLRGRWQVPRELRVKTSGSRVVIDFTDAEFDDWTIDLSVQTTLGDVTLVLPRGMSVQMVGTTSAPYSRLEPPVPGFPVVRLTTTIGFGKLRLKHPRESRKVKKARQRSG